MCQINASPMKKQIGCIDVQGKHPRILYTTAVCLSVY